VPPCTPPRSATRACSGAPPPSDASCPFLALGDRLCFVGPSVAALHGHKSNSNPGWCPGGTGPVQRISFQGASLL
jgi:hypothetical protein